MGRLAPSPGFGQGSDSSESTTARARMAAATGLQSALRRISTSLAEADSGGVRTRHGLTRTRTPEYREHTERTVRSMSDKRMTGPPGRSSTRCSTTPTANATASTWPNRRPSRTGPCTEFCFASKIGAGSKAASTTPLTAPLPHAATTASPPTAPPAPMPPSRMPTMPDPAPRPSLHRNRGTRYDLTHDATAGLGRTQGPDVAHDVAHAIALAQDAHRGQFRYSGDPYVKHPIAVGLILSQIEADPPTVVAGVLHHLATTSMFDPRRVRESFGDTVGDLITHSRSSIRARRHPQPPITTDALSPSRSPIGFTICAPSAL